MNEPKPNTVINKLNSQKETLKMAAYFSKKENTLLETLFGLIATVVFYGVGLGFLIYMIYTQT